MCIQQGPNTELPTLPLLAEEIRFYGHLEPIFRLYDLTPKSSGVFLCPPSKICVIQILGIRMQVDQKFS